MSKKMDHIEYPKRIQKLPSATLRYIIADCKNVMKAQPHNYNNSFYADEICYCVNELYIRSKKC